MPPKFKPKKRTEVRINDPDLNAAILSFNRLRAPRLSATHQSEEDVFKKQVAELVAGYHKEHGVDIYRTSNGVAIQLAPNAGQASIDGKKLLELGVDPDIIKKATVRNPYIVYTPIVPADDAGHAVDLLGLGT